MTSSLLSSVSGPVTGARPRRSSVPISSSRRRRRVGLAIAAVALVLLSACGQGANTPAGYGVVTQSNFLKGCLASFGVDVEGAFDVTATTDLVMPEGATASQTGYCNCVYGGLSAPVLGDDGEPVETAEGEIKTELPYDDFKQINSDLKSNVGDDSPDTTGGDGGDGGDGASTGTEALFAEFDAALGDDVSQGARTTTFEVLEDCLGSS